MTVHIPIWAAIAIGISMAAVIVRVVLSGRHSDEANGVDMSAAVAGANVSDGSPVSEQFGGGMLAVSEKVVGSVKSIGSMVVSGAFDDGRPVAHQVIEAMCREDERRARESTSMVCSTGGYTNEFYLDQRGHLRAKTGARPYTNHSS